MACGCGCSKTVIPPNGGASALALSLGTASPAVSAAAPTCCARGRDWIDWLLIIVAVITVLHVVEANNQ